MDNKKKIEILKETAEAFRQSPDPKLYNDRGICYYLRNRYKFALEQIADLLQEKYAFGYYTFGIDPNFTDEFPGSCQMDLWKENSLYKYDRAEWCEQQIKKLEEE